MKPKKLTVIALGSNLGERQHNLSKGIIALKQAVDIEKCSNIYSSKALLPDNANKDWDMDFYNCVFYGKTALEPTELLEFCNKIEKEVAGSDRNKGSWAPRYLDVDIIAYDNEIIDTNNLKIPHPRMSERSFVIMPLTEILPNWQHPLTKKTSAQILKEADFDDRKIKRLDIKPL